MVTFVKEWKFCNMKDDLFNTKEELTILQKKSEIDRTITKSKDRDLLLDDRAHKKEYLSKELPPLPVKKYQLIYIDPPWKYNFSRSNSREIENQYPTMSLDEIKRLPIGSLAEDDSVLFLWATSPKLEEAFEVINAYGFKYVTSAIWDKLKIGMGYYFRGRHEFLLVSKKGNLPVPDPKNRVASIIEVPRGKHSKKPVELYEILDKMYPNATKIEIFSRIRRNGWDTWGFEEGKLPVPEYMDRIGKRKWEI